MCGAEKDREEESKEEAVYVSLFEAKKCKRIIIIKTKKIKEYNFEGSRSTQVCQMANGRIKRLSS